MSAELGKELRMELHYGLDYIGKAITDGQNKTNAANKIIEARSALASYISSVQNNHYFRQTLNSSNDVIEMDPDVVADSELAKDVSSSVKDIKICIGGFGMAIDKILKIRLERMPEGVNPKNSYNAIRSLDRAVDAIESSIGFLFNELQDISKKNPGVYPTFQPEESSSTSSGDERTVPSEAVSTDALMENRAAERTAGKTGTDENFIDGSINRDFVVKSEVVTAGETEMPTEENSASSPADPTEGFSEDQDNDMSKKTEK